MDSVRLLNDRPMVLAALAFIAGIYFGDLLSGTGLFIALCCFIVLSISAALFQNKGTCLAAALLAAGLFRVLLGRLFSLPSLPALTDLLLAMRSRLTLRTAQLFPKNGGMLSAMLWGDTANMVYALRQDFQEIGVGHIFALSGLHVSFFTGGIALLIKKPKARFAVTFAFLLIYAAITGFSASLVRASVMSLIVLGAGLIGRKNDTASSLGLAALLILAVSPGQLYEVGFQLSFLAVASIAMLYRPLKKALRPIGRSASEALSLSIAGTLGTLPLTVLYFGRLSLVSLFSNLLLLPCVPFAMIGGFLAVLFSFVSPLLSFLPHAVADFLLSAMAAVGSMTAALPFASVRFSLSSSFPCLLLYLGLFCVSRYPLLPRRIKAAGGHFFLLAAVALSLLML